MSAETRALGSGAGVYCGRTRANVEILTIIIGMSAAAWGVLGTFVAVLVALFKEDITFYVLWWRHPKLVLNGEIAMGRSMGRSGTAPEPSLGEIGGKRRRSPFRTEITDKS